MKIELTKKQYRDLLLNIIIGVYIRESVDEQEGKDIRNVRDIEQYWLSLAKDFDSEDLIENLEEGSEKDYFIPSNKVIKEYHDHYIEGFEEDSFWHNLIMRLGQRDFAQNATEVERQKVKQNDGWMTGVIDKYYKKYEDEFEKNGLDKFIIVKDVD